jgi:DNA-binding beta-propeller fold protein YncE
LGSNDVSAYTIDATTGVLSAIPGSPFAAGTAPFSVAVDPSDKFTYVANWGSNNISVFKIDPTIGAPTSVAGSAFAAESGPAGITVDPFARFVYVANFFSNNVSAYTLDPVTGTLTRSRGRHSPRRTNLWRWLWTLRGASPMWRIRVGVLLECVIPQFSPVGSRRTPSTPSPVP